ncbi:MAG: hypothetical protein RRZ68_07760, partial [Oscillospiraceae bacterium]
RHILKRGEKMENIAFKIPVNVLDKMHELTTLCEENPQYIPLPKISKFLGANAEGLRRSIESGQCPFGISWQKNIGGNKAFKIPTAKFYFWFGGEFVKAMGLAEMELKKEV